MAKVFSRNCLRVVVAAICQSIGWKKIKPTSLELLIDLLENYMRSLAKGAHGYAEQRGSTIPVIEDLALALDDAGVTIPPLEEYIREVGRIPCPKNLGLVQLDSVPVYPVQPPSHRRGEREQHLQFFDSWAESDEDSCAYLVPPTQRPAESSSAYHPEVSVVGDNVETFGSEIISRPADSITHASQTPVVAMTEYGVLSASRDGRQASSRRPITPPNCSPSPDRPYASVERAHKKKEKKKKKGKENSGVGKLKVKTGFGMGKQRSSVEIPSGHSQNSAFAIRYHEKKKIFKSHKYTNSSSHGLNSLTSKSKMQPPQKIDRNYSTPVKFGSPKMLYPSEINNSVDNKLLSDLKLTVPDAVSNHNYHSIQPCLPERNAIPQSTDLLEEKPKSDILDSLHLNVPIKQEPVDNVPMTENSTPLHASCNTEFHTVCIKTESESNNIKEEIDTIDGGLAQGHTKQITSLVNPALAEPDGNKCFVPFNQDEIGSQSNSSVPSEKQQGKCDNDNINTTCISPSSGVMIPPSVVSSSVSVGAAMSQGSVTSKVEVANVSKSSNDERVKHSSKSGNESHSKKHHKSKKSLSKEDRANHKKHHCNKKRKHSAISPKAQQKTGGLWDNTLNELFAPDIIQKKKKSDFVKDKDMISSEVKKSLSTHKEKLNNTIDEIQKPHATKEVTQPSGVKKLNSNIVSKHSITKPQALSENLVSKVKLDNCINKAASYIQGEEQGPKHARKKVKEEMPSTSGVPHWRVNASLIYSSSSDSEIDVGKPSDISYGTPPTVFLPETPKTPRTPDVPIDVYKHTKCKKVVDKTSDTHLGADLGTPPPARPPTPGVSAPVPAISVAAVSVPAVSVPVVSVPVVSEPVVKVNKEKHKHKKKKKKHEKKHHSPKKEHRQHEDKPHSNSDLVAAECLMQLTSVSGGQNAAVSSNISISSKKGISSSKKKSKLLPSEPKKKHHSMVTPLPSTVPSPAPHIISTSVKPLPSIPKVNVPVNSLAMSISDDGPVGFYFDEFGNRVWVCPSCGGQDDGSPMIRCDDCYAWYHWTCVGIDSAPDENVDWFCSYCFSKKDKQSKKHKSSSLHRKKSHSKSSRK